MPRRFQSQFDPDELNKITHRGMQKLSRAQFEERVSQEEVTNLKSRQQEEDTLVVQIRRFFLRIIDGVVSSIRALFTPPKKKVVQCETYGHALKPGWTGAHPICTDCGAPILDPKDVRAATPKAKEKPGEFKQQDRKYVK